MKRCLPRVAILILLVISLPAVLCGAIADTPESTEQYKYALGLIQRQLYDEALSVLQRVLSDPAPFSRRDAATYWYAECFYRLGKFPEAIGAYQKLRKEFPASSLLDRAAYGLGWTHVRNNDPKSAIESFNKVGTTDGKLWIDARLKMGLLMVKFNMDAETAAKVYEQLLSRKDLTDGQLFEALFQAGGQRFNQGSFVAAAEHFTNSIAKAPPEQLPSVLFFLAESYFRSNKFNDASVYYQRVLDASGSPEISDKSRYSLAWCHIKLGTFDAAVSLLEQLSENPAAANRSEAVKNLVDLLMNLRKFPEAISWMRKAAKILDGEQAIEMDYMRGLALSRMGEFPEALETFREFSRKYPKLVRSQEARYQASLMYVTMGKFREALKELEPLLRREVLPEVREKALYRTGECYLNLANLKNARDAFERVLREYPKGSARLDTLYQLGEVEYQTGNYSGALDAFKTLGASGGEVAGQAQFRAGEVLMKAGRYTDAIKDFEAYLSNFGSAPLVDDARFKIGLCYLELKDPGKALAAFSQLRESKGYFRQEARFQIGEIARGLANYPLAIQQLQAILAEEPKHPLASRARRAVGICLQMAKDFPAAEQMFREILKEYPATDVAVPESRYWLGKNLISQGRVEDGILELLKVPILYPKSPLVTEAYAEAARGYQTQGLTARSDKMWKELLKVNPKGPLADEAREHLKK